MQAACHPRDGSDADLQGGVELGKCMRSFVRCYALHGVGCIAQGEGLKPGVVKITVVAPIKKTGG